MTVSLSPQAEKRLEDLRKQYPQPRSVIMAALYIAQEELGFIDQRAVDWVSEKTGIPPAHVREVATFYTLYYKKPVGRYHIQVCRTVSCALRGSKKVVEYLKKRFQLMPNQVSADGMWSYEEVECLGACGMGPMCEINDHYFENLSEEKLEEILRRIENEKPDLRLSAVKDALGAGLAGHPKTEIQY